jgi:hypothetical protein
LTLVAESLIIDLPNERVFIERLTGNLDSESLLSASQISIFTSISHPQELERIPESVLNANPTITISANEAHFPLTPHIIPKLKLLATADFVMQWQIHSLILDYSRRKLIFVDPVFKQVIKAEDPGWWCGFALQANTYEILYEGKTIGRSISPHSSGFRLSIIAEDGMMPKCHLWISRAIFHSHFEPVDIPQSIMCIEISKCYVEFTASRIPFRLIVEIDQLSSEIEKTAILQGHFGGSINAFVSNIREAIPLKLFAMEKPDFGRYGFPKLGELKMEHCSLSVFPDLLEIRCEKAVCVIGFCSDLFSLVSSLFPGKAKMRSAEELEALFRSSLDHSSASEDAEFPSLNEVPFPVNIMIDIAELELSVNFFDGRDLPELFDLRVFEKSPEFTFGEVSDLDFEFVTARRESRKLEISVFAQSKVSFGTNGADPFMRLELNSSHFDVRDHLPESRAKLMLSIESENQLKVGLDWFFKTNHCKLIVELPALGMFVDHHQLEFLGAFFSRNSAFGSRFVSESLRIDVFALRGRSLWLSAHLKCFLGIALEDLELSIPECVMTDISGFSTLIGKLAAFYSNKIGKWAFVSGLPVLSSFRKIADSIGRVFSVDIDELGVARGIGVALASILKTVAVETINTGGTMTSAMESLLKCSVELVSGEVVQDAGVMATLIMSCRAGYEDGGVMGGSGQFLKQMLRVVLTPGIVALRFSTRMLGYLKDSVEIDDKERKYEKDSCYVYV